jgi:uncharacterized protein YyaL (SSP411 family)
VAALALNRLGHLLGEERFIHSAERTLKAAMQDMAHYPQGYGALLNAFDEWACPPQIVIIRGINDEMDSWQQLALGQYVPSRLCFSHTGYRNQFARFVESTKIRKSDCRLCLRSRCLQNPN